MKPDNPIDPIPHDETQDLVDQLRTSALEETEKAPTIGRKRWASKEIKTQRSPWLMRSLVFLLLLALATDAYLIVRQQRTPPEIVVQAAPPVETLPTPTIQAPFPTPEIEGRQEAMLPPELPTPTEAPWPEGVEDIEFPEPDE